ncbi:hypothetical protein ES703_107968 [subsurface metagenome]
MKKIISITLLIALSLPVFCQANRTIDWYNWSDPITYLLSPNPVITGYGVLSDSLSEIHDGKTFYEYNNDYYSIETWADYYYWFTKKYWYQFREPQLYEFYYLTENDYGMASYIAGGYYRGYYYPSRIAIRFTGRIVGKNRLGNNRHFAKNSKEITRLDRRLKNGLVRADEPAQKNSVMFDNRHTNNTPPLTRYSQKKTSTQHSSYTSAGRSSSSRSSSGSARATSSTSHSRPSSASARTTSSTSRSRPSSGSAKASSSMSQR